MNSLALAGLFFWLWLRLSIVAFNNSNTKTEHPKHQIPSELKKELGLGGYFY